MKLLFEANLISKTNEKFTIVLEVFDLNTDNGYFTSDSAYCRFVDEYGDYILELKLNKCIIKSAFVDKEKWRIIEP